MKNFDSKIERAIDFYYKTARLKEVLRSGPVQWQVEKEVMETIASHIYGTQMLAIALQSELQLDVDFSKVLLMLAIHETEEILIGDLTPLDEVSKAKKKEIGSRAVSKIFSVLSDGQKYVDVLEEYSAGQTKEAHFARLCDKLECVLEFKKYCDEGLTSLDKATPQMLKHPRLKQFYDEGKLALDDIFYVYHMKEFEDLGFTQEVWFDCIKKIKTKK